MRGAPNKWPETGGGRGKDGGQPAAGPLADGHQILPVSLCSRVGMTQCAIATFEGSTFVGMRAFRIWTILLTVVGWGEIILV